MPASRQRGLSLIIVLLVLIVVAVLGVGAAQMAMLGEKATRYDRNHQIAWEAAEAALVDATYDINGITGATFNRSALFPGYSGMTPANLANFVSGCGSASPSATSNEGLCIPNATGTKPLAYTVNFTSANAVSFGAFTGRIFSAGMSGTQPAIKPSYIIEILRDLHSQSSLNAPAQNNAQYIYRITAMGFGPTTDTQVVLQMVYRKPG